EADAVQVSFAASQEGGPDGLSLALIDVPEVPEGAAVTGVVGSGDAVVRSAFGTGSFGEASFGTASFDATAAATAQPAATAGAPRVISRAEWGARPQVCTPNVTSKLVGAVVHHTAGRNTYSTVAEAMRQIR